MKTAEVLIQMLLDAGVSRVYGVSGDSLNAFTDSIRTNEGIEWVHVRHEEVGAFAAGAEAHLTDELAVCAVVAAPETFILLMGCSTVIAAACPYSQSRLKSRASNSATTTFKKLIRRSFTRNAVITALSFPSQINFPVF